MKKESKEVLGLEKEWPIDLYTHLMRYNSFPARVYKCASAIFGSRLTGVIIWAETKGEKNSTRKLKEALNAAERATKGSNASAAGKWEILSSKSLVQERCEIKTHLWK